MVFVSLVIFVFFVVELLGYSLSYSDFFSELRSNFLSLFLPFVIVFIDYTTTDFRYYPTLYFESITPYWHLLLLFELFRECTRLELKHLQPYVLFLGLYNALYLWKFFDPIFSRLPDLYELLGTPHFLFPLALGAVYYFRTYLLELSKYLFVVLSIMYFGDTVDYKPLEFLCVLLSIALITRCVLSSALRRFTPLAVLLLLFIIFSNQKRVFLLCEYTPVVIILTSFLSDSPPFSLSSSTSSASSLMSDKAKELDEVSVRHRDDVSSPSIPSSPTSSTSAVSVAKHSPVSRIYFARLVTAILLNYMIVAYGRVGGRFDMNADVAAANNANGNLFHITTFKWWAAFLMAFEKFGVFFVAAIFLAFSGLGGKIPANWHSVATIYFLKVLNLNMLFEIMFIVARGYLYHFVFSCSIGISFLIFLFVVLLRVTSARPVTLGSGDWITLSFLRHFSLTNSSKSKN
eukprot:GILI01023987.1.p1 GENE.GILI01023987.1~~GILI01023987.1.p1  ORF type:complete len:460 (-),score=72.35 GILI01023987.1:218-1597(-)